MLLVGVTDVSVTCRTPLTVTPSPHLHVTPRVTAQKYARIYSSDTNARVQRAKRVQRVAARELREYQQ